MTKSKQFIFIIAVLASCLVLFLLNYGKTGFSVSVIDLLPGDDIETRILRELATDTQGRQLFIRLYSDAGTVPEEATTTFSNALESSTAINKVWRTGQKGFREIGTLLFNDRYFWLLPHWLEREYSSLDSLSSIDAKDLARRVVHNLDNYLQSPDSMVLVDVIPRDPFLLMDDLDQRLPIANQTVSETEVFLWAEQSESPFSDGGQEAVFDALESALIAAQGTEPGLQMEFTGISVFANASKQAIKGEIQRLNSMGIFLVLLISTLAVRSLIVMSRIVLVVAVALVVAATAVVTVFESVHVIALVIGSILTGIAVDYAFHLILKDDFCLSEKDTKKAVISGSLSSALGFLVLIGAPLPFLRQVGVFVGAGLIAALLAAMVLRGNLHHSLRVRAWKFTPAKLPAWVGVLLLVVTFPGLLLLSWKSNINDLEYPLPELKEIDARIMHASSPIRNRHAYLVFDDDLYSARKHLGMIDSSNQFIHAGNLLPEFEDVLATSNLIREMDGFREALNSSLEEKDYYPDAFEAFFRDWETYRNVSITKSMYVDKVQQFSSKLPGPLKSLVHEGNAISWFMIVSDRELELSDDSRLIHLDQANMLSRAFADYGGVMWVFSAICLVVLVITVCIYFGTLAGLAALMTPAIAGLMAFGIIGYWQKEIGLFHLVGALLAFCISLDYGLFSVTSRRTGRKLPKSISISFLTTVAVFGVLASSHVPAVHQLAMTILLILGCSIIVILIRWPGQRELPPSPFERIPHGPVARMVEQVLHIDSGSIRALCNPHVHQSMPSECLVEAMAQCAAVLLAENKSKDGPRLGMLVVVQSCKLSCKYIVPGQSVETTVELQSEAEEGLVLFSGRCVDADQTLAEASFSIFIPPAKDIPQ